MFSMNLLHRCRMKITSHICSVVICMELCLTLSYKGFTYFKRYSIFCMNLFYLILPLPASASLSFGAVMLSWNVVTLGSSLQSQWDGKGLFWRLTSCFPGCFWKVAHILAYYADTLEFLVYYRDWTWLGKSCSVLCPGNHIFKISSKKKKKLYKFWFLHLHILISHFLSPVLFPVKS